MGPYALVNRALGVAAELPGLRHMRQSRYERAFADQENVNYYRGIYESFDAAAASAPDTKAIGYDNPDSAALYDGWDQPFLKDYPAMFWLRDGLDQGMRTVFDLGGHVGVKFYAFESWLKYPKGARWTVCDVPAVVRRGREVAATRDQSGMLHFTESVAEADGQHILFASGSLQYLPWTLDQKLSRMKQMPRRLVINTTAIHPTRTFYTLNSIGTAFCPYRVQAEGEFVGALETLGYRKRDRWETPKQFIVPFQDGYDLDHYTGFCFER